MNKAPRTTAVTLVSIAWLVCACAPIASLRPFEYTLPTDRGVFAPVRLEINRDAPVPEFYQSRLDLVASELESSGAFHSVGQDVDSEYVLDVRLGRHTTDTAVDTANQMLSAVTLFLIPSTAHNVNKLEVDCYVDGVHVRRYEYTGAYEERISLFNYRALSEGGDEFVSIRNMLNHLIRDLDHDDILPRVPAVERADNVAQELSI